MKYLKNKKKNMKKLDALQKKSPEDLYEDDISHFEAEYHKVMEKERADEMSEVAHYTTKKLPGLVIVKVVKNKQLNHNVQKLNQLHMVNVLHQLLIQH